MIGFRGLAVVVLPLLAACGVSSSSTEKGDPESLFVGGFSETEVGTCNGGFVKLGFDLDADLVVTLTKDGDTGSYDLFMDEECKEKAAGEQFTIPKGSNFADVYVLFSSAGSAILGAKAAGYGDAETVKVEAAAAP